MWWKDEPRVLFIRVRAACAAKAKTKAKPRPTPVLATTPRPNQNPTHTPKNFKSSSANIATQNSPRPQPIK